MPDRSTAAAHDEPGHRRIVHVDMDAFYASVEQRDNPELRGRPVVVAWRGQRSVVCAASYEARRFGIRSAMPALRAARLCPEAVFVAPDFPRYRAVSAQVFAILGRHSPLVEPVSLDEAYLDVTGQLARFGSATAVAEQIRAEIRDELALTASAGVAPNKFLAKVASDWRKPDGLFVIRPQRVRQFLDPLPVDRLPGVGRVGAARLAKQGCTTVADVRRLGTEGLLARFGSWGVRLAELAEGLDPRPVRNQREPRLISAERTLGEDRLLVDLQQELAPLAERVWQAALRRRLIGSVVVLKLKTAEFRSLTRQLGYGAALSSSAQLAELAWSLAARVDQPGSVRYRLIGLALGGLQDALRFPLQQDLFAGVEQS